MFDARVEGVIFRWQEEYSKGMSFSDSDGKAETRRVQKP